MNNSSTPVLFLIAIAISLVLWRRKVQRERQRKEAGMYAQQLDSLVVGVDDLVNRFEAVFDFEFGYLMKRDYDKLMHDITPIANKLLAVPEQYRNSHIKVQNINKLLGYYSNPNLREKRNDDFKKHELELCSNLFENINGMSLDDQQRNCIVTDEYSNLVIAGAGSGKTLTVIGKLKYLIERWGVKPEEILVTSFTRKSVDELAGRISSAGILGVATKTFHSIGLAFLNKPGVANENELKKCILRYLRSEILESPQQIQAYLEFYGCYSYVPEDYDEFDCDSDRIQELKSMDLTTLKGQINEIAAERKKTHDTLQGERVKSVEELMIANHFFLNGIKYEYEKNYSGVCEPSSTRAYQPDFYLSDYDIWLEHFGITEDGRVPWIGSSGEERKYIEGIEWKRKTHKQNQTSLIESYSFWNKDNKLIDNLDSLLKSSGVELKEDIDELVQHYERLRQDEKLLQSIVSLISTFVSLYKASNMTLDGVNRKALSEYRNNAFMLQRYRLFIEFVAPIINFYQLTLEEQDTVDFDDMINRATEVIQSNGFPGHYKYIIVDEYQDISVSRFGLINAIRQKTDAKLICVGDDWQSICRFAGSDVTLFTYFEQFCGFHEELKIENTYRNSQNLIDTASDFIMENTNQLLKKMVSQKQPQNPNPIAILSLKSQIRALSQALDEILSTKDFNGNILILGRHNNDWESLFDTMRATGSVGNASEEFIWHRDIKSGDINISYKGYSNIKFLSVHRSKGLEADEVIVLNVVNDKYGFPNKIVDDPLLNLLLAKSDECQYAEERRLFYVAMTRTKNRIYLITNHIEDFKGRSVFINELIENDLEATIRLIEEDGDRQLVNCPRCGKGVLVIRRNSANGREFLGCTNYPFCEKTYSGTEILEQQVKCPQCGGWMVKRSRADGEFYGCTNFPQCKKTINVADSNADLHKHAVHSSLTGAPNRPVRMPNNFRSGNSTFKDVVMEIVSFCPECGAPMKERHGKYGVFYGCSRFPSCSYTKKI